LELQIQLMAYRVDRDPSTASESTPTSVLLHPMMAKMIEVFEVAIISRENWNAAAG
jgi:hypothetical protein